MAVAVMMIACWNQREEGAGWKEDIQIVDVEELAWGGNRMQSVGVGGEGGEGKNELCAVLEVGESG